MRTDKRTFHKLMLLLTLFGIASTIAIFEAFIRSSQGQSSYLEKNGQPVIEVQVEPWLWTLKKNSRWTHKKPEYEQEFVTNSEGLIGDLPSTTKKKNEVRVIVIGDSVTQGVGDLSGDGLPFALRKILNKNSGSKKYSIINAGVAGSDPVFGIQLLQRQLLKFSPDIVLFTINSTDIFDLMGRGGLDRFDANGFLKKRQTPVWTWLFDRSHVFRTFILGWLHYDWNLLSPEESRQARTRAIANLVESGRVAKQLSELNKFKLLMLVHPTVRDIKNRKVPDDLLEIETGLKNANINSANLLDFFLHKFPGEIGPEYYWPQDLHFTHKGYEVFGDAVATELKQRKLL